MIIDKSTSTPLLLDYAFPWAGAYESRRIICQVLGATKDTVANWRHRRRLPHPKARARLLEVAKAGPFRSMSDAVLWLEKNPIPPDHHARKQRHYDG
jgi:hypothetical protein